MDTQTKNKKKDDDLEYQPNTKHIYLCLQITKLKSRIWEYRETAENASILCAKGCGKKIIEGIMMMYVE